jgi:quercetin dioxygenase-like cupin family protein
MAIVDISQLPEIERLPGWHGRFFHSEHMTVAHYDFTRGASIHEHDHPQEEIYHVLEGELEMTIAGETQMARPGLAAIVPANARHSVKALSDGRVLIVDSPRRPDAAGER